MGTSLREVIKHLLDSMQERRSFNALDQNTQSMLDRALDKVIDGTDPRIMAVPGYERRLYHAILKSLEHADALIDQIPHPIDLDTHHFTTDPYLRAIFPTLGGLKRVYNQSSELKDYFEEYQHQDDQEGCALLCMRKEEQAILGMELEGDHVIRDVKQTRVSFAGHRIYSPAETESEARRELKCCIFEGLVNNALEMISELRAKHDQLDTDQQILTARLRSQMKRDQSVEETARALEKVETELQQIGYLTPQRSLDIVNDILDQPSDYVSLHNISLCLDKSGIKRSCDVSQSASLLQFSEIHIRGQMPRVVTLAKVRREEVNPQN